MQQGLLTDRSLTGHRCELRIRHRLGNQQQEPSQGRHATEGVLSSDCSLTQLNEQF